MYPLSPLPFPPETVGRADPRVMRPDELALLGSFRRVDPALRLGNTVELAQDELV